MKTGEVLTLRSFKTRAKKKAENTKGFYKMTSPIALIGVISGFNTKTRLKGHFPLY